MGEAPAAVHLPAGLEHAAPTDDGRYQVIVELEDPPAALVFADAMRGASPRDKRALAIAGAASRAQVQKIAAVQESVAKELAASSIGAREIYRVSRALNGIAVAVAPQNLASLSKVRGVKRVLPLLLEYPTSSISVPFIGAPNVWANTIGLPAGADGTGVRIGIIDTGVDYMHGDFGGTGVLADYQAGSTNTASFTTLGIPGNPGAFPTAKVVGGHDFAGDAYNGNNTPTQDVNPMDCNGHGSHVSGIAAGFGVTAAGATFTGPYDANPATYSGLRIAPGSAPKASLYGIRVFGCVGATTLAIQGIDWAMDPNGDGDLSDHLDVINMSLGSDFGSVLNGTAIAAENAVLAGVIVVTSTGNASDTFFNVSAPGVASRIIATAASVDGGEITSTVMVNAPAGIAGPHQAGAALFGSQLTASGTPPGPHNVVIALDPADAAGPSTTDGCSPLTNAAAVAGNIALIDRGTCGFTVKVKNAQNAGAVGVIIADNAIGSPPPGLGGTDATITIPSVRVTQLDGNTLKANIASLNVTLFTYSAGDTMAFFSSRGPRRIFGTPLRLKPDISAPGSNIVSVQTGHTCTAAAGCAGVSDPSGFQAGNQALFLSGTSMASPHVTGVMALLRQLHPDWSVEELKALVMNYALHDLTLFGNATPPRFGPSRIGAGRVAPDVAALGEVVAMNADDAGVVSVTFDPQVVGTATQTKKIRLVNKGLTPQTFDLGFDNIVNSPGVTYSLPGGNTVTVPAADTVELDIQMSANTALMDHTHDPTLFPTQGLQANYGDQPRNFLTEHEAYLTFSQASAVKLRLPVYMAEKPSSDMAGPAMITTGGAPTGSTTIPLSGTDLCTGTLAAGPTCTGVGTMPKIESMVSPFELQVVSPLDPVHAPDYADIQYAGAAYFQAGGTRSVSNDLILFGVSTWGDWSSMDDFSVSICVDTNGDGVYDKIVYNTNPSIFVANSSANDNFVRVIRDATTNGNTILGLGSFVNLLSPASFDTGAHLNNVMVLGATPAQLGIATTATTSIRYKVVTCSATNPGCSRTTTGDHCSPAAGTFFDQAPGPYTYNWGAQGLNFGGAFFSEDLNGSSLPVTWNTANMTANGSLGALLLHHQNGTGKRAQVVLLQGVAAADLGVTVTVDNATPAAGANVLLTITVTNHGPNDATGVVVSDSLPNGLNYVADDGGGAYNSGTGLWAPGGTLANGASLVLHITATAATTDEVVDVAEVTAGTPLDPNPANNRATVALQAPRSADLHLTASADVASVHPGGTINYTLTVKNNGGDPAYSVNVQEAFPLFPSLSPGSFTVSQGLYNPATGVWNLASLPVGSTATLHFAITAPQFAGGLVNNSSTVSNKEVMLRGVRKAADPNLADNSASVTVQVVSPATVTGTKSVTGSFVEGGAVTYTIILSNSSDFDQQDNPGHELTDVLPAQLNLVSASATAGTAVATVATNTVTWDGAVPAHGTVTVTIHATIKAGTALQTVSNQANANFDADGNGTNESVAATATPGTGGPTTFLVVSPASIGTHTKTVTGSFLEGGTVTYTVTISNPSANAQLDNPGDEFTDVLPASLTLVGASASSGTATADIPGHTVHWNGSIAANGGTVTITITAIINHGFAGQKISNQGTIFFDADGNGTNESSLLTDDPSTAAGDDPTTFQVAAIAQVPTLSEVGLALLALLLASGALFTLRRRRA